MSYETVAQCATDPQMRLRIAAAIAQEDAVGTTAQTGALYQADKIQWQCASEPGWGEAWESAIAGGTTDIGNDPAVISDAMILSAVQKHLPVEVTP